MSGSHDTSQVERERSAERKQEEDHQRREREMIEFVKDEMLDVAWDSIDILDRVCPVETEVLRRIQQHVRDAKEAEHKKVEEAKKAAGGKQGKNRKKAKDGKKGKDGDGAEDREKAEEKRVFRCLTFTSQREPDLYDPLKDILNAVVQICIDERVVTPYRQQFAVLTYDRYMAVQSDGTVSPLKPDLVAVKYASLAESIDKSTDRRLYWAYTEVGVEVKNCLAEALWQECTYIRCMHVCSRDHIRAYHQTDQISFFPPERRNGRADP